MRHYGVGEEVPVTGDYRARHLVDGRMQRVFLTRGSFFPSCLACGEAVRFELVGTEVRHHDRQSSIMVHRLPHPDPEPAATGDLRPVGDARRNEKRPRPSGRAHRLRFGEYYADIIRDPHDDSIWIYVVQRKGSPDVLAMGTGTSKHQACDLANGAMRHLGHPSSGAAVAS